MSAKNIGFCLISVIVFFAIKSSGQCSTIEGARKEGKLAFYTGLLHPEISAITKAFEAKYPFIEMKTYRAGGHALLTKILTEHKANQNLFDVASGRPEMVAVLKNRGLIEKYCSKEREFIDENLKDRDCIWTSIFIFPHVLAYNSSLVNAADVPKKYEDLISNKWKGKISIDTAAYDWLAGLILAWGREKAVSYVKKLAALDPVLQRGHTIRIQLIGAGESPLGFLYASHVTKFKKKGMPLDWVPLEPVPIQQHIMLLSSKGPNSSAGKLFIDFMLSREGQKILQRFNRVTVRSDTPPDPPELFSGYKKIVVPPKPESEAKEIIKLYNDIFGL